MKQKNISILIAVCSFALCLFAVAAISDTPVSIKIPANRSSIAAIAIRDNVIPFQKFGTRLFTLPYLEKCYGRVCYFTQEGKYDKKNAFVDSLNVLLEQYPVVDIYLLAHANTYHRWVEEVPEELRKNIRLVYNTGCAGSDQCANWLSLGAKTYVGHPGKKSISPVFYFFFLRRWAAGERLDKALAESNERMLSKMKGLVPADDLMRSQAICFGDSLCTIGR